MDDRELEAHIVDCGEHMLRAYAEGNRLAAAQWLALQNEAIASRSPEQVARMESCFFSERGASDRAALKARA